MSLVTAIYLVSVVSKLSVLMYGVNGVIFFAAIFIGIGILMDSISKESILIHKKLIKSTAVLFLIALVLSVLIPTKNEMYAMLAVNQANELKLDETAKKGIEVLNIKLDEIIAETKKD